MLGYIIKAVTFALLMTILAISYLWLTAYHPKDIEPVKVHCERQAPLCCAKRFKVLSYNVQYMASKNYVFFYDIDEDDEERRALLEERDQQLARRPSREHVYWTLDEVANIILNEDPDVVLLQEVSGKGDSRTHFIDQTSELLSRLNDQYPCYAEASYWKANYILHPDVMGAVDMKLLTLSKYKIDQAHRHQLPRIERNALVQPFHFQRANLVANIATRADKPIVAINTHFEAWAAGTGIMQQQVAQSMEFLETLDQNNVPWVFGGDLNLLPPDGGKQLVAIHANDAGEFDKESQLRALYGRYRGIPSLQNLMGKNASSWFTHFPNDPKAMAPDRTIDYVFYSDLWQLTDAYVLHDSTWVVSDHLPVIGVWSYPLLEMNTHGEAIR